MYRILHFKFVLEIILIAWHAIVCVGCLVFPSVASFVTVSWQQIRLGMDFNKLLVLLGIEAKSKTKSRLGMDF